MKLLDVFTNHYNAVDANNRLRCFYCTSWDAIDRSDEVGAIYNYITGKGVGLDYLNFHVATKLSSPLFDVKFAGVFSHKKPIIYRTAAAMKANPSRPLRCELGDLLVSFLLLDSDDQPHYYASSLFQAKVKDRIDNKTQQHLYDDDRSFNLPKNLGGAKRDFPKLKAERSRALRYLLMGKHRNNCQIDARCSPWKRTRSVAWGDFMHHLVQGADGLQALPRGTGSEWDLINHDLLTMASKVPPKKPRRGSDVAVQLATGSFNNFSARDHWYESSDAEGIPTIMVIAAAKERWPLLYEPTCDVR